MNKSRRWLYGVLAVGLLGIGAGGGTFASFNASTTNPGNAFTTGSLYLSNTAHSGTACFSYNGSDNANGGCSAVVTTNGLEGPGSPITIGTVTVANTGTIDGSTLSLTAGACTDSDRTVSVPAVSVTSGSASVTVAGNFLSLGVGSDMTVTDTTTGANISAGTTVTSVAGSVLTLSQDAAGTGANDTLVFTSQMSATGNPLCGATVAFVEETGQSAGGVSSSNTYCWYGVGVGSSTCTQTLSALNALGANTDTLTDLTAATPLAMAPLSGAGELGTGAGLAAGSSRTFEVGLYLPDTDSSQNSLMDLQSSFNLTWEIAQ